MAIDEKVLIERLKEASFIDYDEYYTDNGECLISISETIKIVKDLTEKHNNGWIPCEVKLPEEGEIVLLSTKNGTVCQGTRHISYGHNRYKLYGMTSTSWDDGVEAWQPLPTSYKKGRSNEN